MRVYEKVRAYIVDNGLEQAAVAQKAGIPNEAFTAILSGKKTLYAEELRVICIDYARQEFNIPRPENTWSNLKDEEYISYQGRLRKAIEEQDTKKRHPIIWEIEVWSKLRDKK